MREEGLKGRRLDPAKVRPARPVGVQRSSPRYRAYSSLTLLLQLLKNYRGILTPQETPLPATERDPPIPLLLQLLCLLIIQIVALEVFVEEGKEGGIFEAGGEIADAGGREEELPGEWEEGLVTREEEGEMGGRRDVPVHVYVV